MELKLGIEVLDSYRRLSYKVWYALAEFVDNSTQSYENYYDDILKKVFSEEKKVLTVNISYKNGEHGFIEIDDNSIGMDQQDLENAMVLGKKPSNPMGRSKYGLGLKTAAFWFGNEWGITTKKYGHKYEYTVIADLNTILKSQKELDPHSKEKIQSTGALKFSKKEVDPNLHYTSIRITKLNRHIYPATARKTKDYLKSIYRYDLQNSKLLLFFQGEQLKWNKQDFVDRLRRDENDEPFYHEFKLKINGKEIKGWAGVLEEGSRKDAGFSLLQSNRVIQGWPAGYKPESLFGDQDGGRNDLVNQRLIGELFMDGFEVSHTKDEILFNDNDEEILDELLFEEIKHLRLEALKPKKKPDIDPEEDEFDVGGIVNSVFSDFQNSKISAAVNRHPVLPYKIIEQNNNKLIERAAKENEENIYEAQIAGINIIVIINDHASEYDPYLVTRARARKDNITIVINRNHQHWDTLVTTELLIYFIKQCIYDGLAEWKANFVAEDINPDTIKLIKDSYLRQEINFQ